MELLACSIAEKEKRALTYWQVYAGYGSGGRDYSDLFKRFGVFLIGPGYRGDYRERSDRYKKEDRDVERLYTEVQQGHKVLLKKPLKNGEWQILAAGVITGDYEYFDAFDDVEGWDLRHGRRVQWYEPVNDQRTIVTGLTQGRLRRVGKNKEALRSITEEILATGKPLNHKEIPPYSLPLEYEELAELLSANDDFAGKNGLVSTLEELRALIKQYRELPKTGNEITEHEARAYLVLPLLQALGWSRERIRGEWKNVDLALFDRDFGEQEDCIAVVETKRFNQGLSLEAVKQARGYADKSEKCDTIVVTDGSCYTDDKTQVAPLALNTISY